jgi:hypothetical protein
MAKPNIYEITPEALLELSTIKSGLGHQFKAEVRAFDSCTGSLMEAYNSVKGIDPEFAKEIQMLIKKSMENSYGLNEAYNQNN